MVKIGTELKDRMTIGLNFQTKSFLKTSVFGMYTRVHHKTLVNIANEYMGSQSVLYNATLCNTRMDTFEMKPSQSLTLEFNR